MKNIILTIAVVCASITALAADPGTKDDNYTVALPLIKEKKYDAAKKLLDEAIKTHPKSLAVLSELGFVEEKQGQKEMALSRYQTILALSINRLLAGEETERVDNARKGLERLAPSLAYLLKEADAIDQASANFNDIGRKRLLEAAEVLRQKALGNIEIPKVKVTPKIRGRYVRVQVQERKQHLTLAEVQVFSRGDNIAPQGKAQQSSLWNGHDSVHTADKAINNITTGTLSAGLCAVTTNKPNPWWQVDLRKTVPIDRITIWGRTDSSPQQSANLTVSVLDEQGGPVWSGFIGSAVPKATLTVK
jgi:hypothetical protein